MNVIKAIAHDLVEKRLWPVALVLVALVVAVPMTLAKPGDPMIEVTAPTEPVTAAGPTLALTPVTTTGFARAPRVNDDRLNPFGVRKSASRKKAATTLSKAADAVISSASSGGGGGASTGGGDTGSSAPVDDKPTKAKPEPKPKPTSVPKVETERDDLLSILLIQGEEPPAEINDIRTLTPLPDAADPFLVYVGKADDGKVSFLVSADVTTKGAGTCSPSPEDCRTLVLGVGDTREFTLVGGEKAGTVISMTVTDLTTKSVPVVEEEDPANAGKLGLQARVRGARALKSVLGDDEVVKALVRQGVKIRH